VEILANFSEIYKEKEKREKKEKRKIFVEFFFIKYDPKKVKH